MTLFLGLITGCVTNSQSEIFVRSSGDPVTSSQRLQFSIFKRKDSTSQENRNNLSVAATCAAIAQAKGFEVIGADEFCTRMVDGCLIVQVNTNIERKKQVYQTQQSTMCSYSEWLRSTSCTTRPSQTVESSVYFKSGFFNVLRFDRENNKLESSLEVATSIRSDMSLFTPLTAEYLCRGFFAGLNQNVEMTFSLSDDDYNLQPDTGMVKVVSE